MSMIYPRVKAARNILREDGVIFISIDENEYSNLKKVCEDVFGGANFVGTIVLQTATDNNETQINIEHEYIICFAKNKSALKTWSRPSAAANLIKEQYLKFRSKYGSDNAAVQAELRKWIKDNKDWTPRRTCCFRPDEGADGLIAVFCA
ncbi:DNA methyltransferase [Erythrobacter tepidarius]|uniref:DNA methyltransferase n=1 Tax=Erythrobacter tepidarius TaxID=60454 RepID=UPI002481EA5A|nr:DNA methyltransferase [Erythrobacter tepidarius]